MDKIALAAKRLDDEEKREKRLETLFEHEIPESLRLLVEGQREILKKLDGMQQPKR